MSQGDAVPAAFGRPGPLALPRVRPADMAAVVADPTLLLPEAWRPAVVGFWAYFADCLKDQLALCTRLRSWAEAGVEFDDVLRAFRRMRTPEQSDRFRFESDVLRVLGVYVADAKRDRLNREEAARLRSPVADAERKRVSEMLAELRARWKLNGSGCDGPGPESDVRPNGNGTPATGPAAEKVLRKPPNRGG